MATLLEDTYDYYVDAIQRYILFLDVLRKRGNNYLEHIKKGKPPVLDYDFEMVMDAREFTDRPVNYALVRILPEKGKKVDNKKRPVVIIDPRAGHGPGIGGFKKESEIGAALGKGHPVYFVIFFPDPVPGQTLADVQAAEVKFIEKVSKLHPDSDEPSVIGNCQGGWASMLIGADRPDVTGPIVIAGSPMSYWSGVDGVNPMRYRGGVLGGIWLTSLISDLGNGVFDGANLVSGFEDLNPANTYWKKPYHLYANVDTEEQRFLDFEKWWGGFYSMTDEEIHFIVNNLFIGNRLEQGKLMLDKNKRIDLSNLEDPVVVFASQGDNITPPQQALNWITTVYGSVEEIRRKQQVLVYMVHKKIGHLGIFVSSSVAQKEHKEIVGSLDQIEFLPPGLYEMIIEQGESDVPGDHKVRFEERDIKDIKAMDDGTKDEEDFGLVADVSLTNDWYYRTFIGPWVKLFSNGQTAEFFKQMHPLRRSRYTYSDLNPFLTPVTANAPAVKENRQVVKEDNPYLVMEKMVSKSMEDSLNFYRDVRDINIEFMFKAVYGNPWMKELFSSEGEATLAEGKARKRPGGDKTKEEKAEIRADRKHWMGKMEKGGFVEGVLRIILALAYADRTIDRTEFDILDRIRTSHKRFKNVKTARLRTIAKEQSRIVQTDEDRAVKALAKLLKTKKERKEALGIAQKLVFADGVLAPEEKALLQKIKKAIPA